MLNARTWGRLGVAGEPSSDERAVSITRIPALRPLRGECGVAADKSIAHRVMLLGAVAAGRTRIRNFDVGADNRSTLAFVQALGTEAREDAGEVCMIGGGWEGIKAPRGPLYCGNSGTTMRLGVGLLAGRPFVARLTGDASLLRRPMARVVEPLRAMGAGIVSEGEGGRPPLVLNGGPLQGLEHRLRVASAQVKSAILIAGLQADGETVVIEPERTRDHTERLLPAFGARVRVRQTATESRRISVSGPTRLTGTSVTLPGDFSSAAFFIVAALLVPGSDVRLTDIGLNPTRTGMLEVLRAMGASIEIDVRDRESGAGEPIGNIRVRSGELEGVIVDPSLVPLLIDEIPLLCVAAACAGGRTSITGASELRVKESDRIAAMAAELRKMRVAVHELPDGLIIDGTGPATSGRPHPLGGATVDSYGDHRIAMALTVAGLVADGGVTIEGGEIAEVSFPGFYKTLTRLAGG